MKKVINVLFLLFFFLTISIFVNAATLALSPSSGSQTSGSTFSVNILLDTQSVAIDGVDIVYLNYNPSLLEVQDEDSGPSGVQISAGNLLASTLANSVDTTNGRIQFSQTSSGGTTFTGSGTLATVRFRVASTGTASVTFDFTSGSTTDTNVASSGSDVLSSVTNGAYTLSSSSSGGSGGGSSGGGGGGSGGGGGGGGGGGLTFVCNMDWQCTEWSSCTNGFQIRRCDFTRVSQHSQGTPCPEGSNPPLTSQRCVVPQAEQQTQVREKQQEKREETILTSPQIKEVVKRAKSGNKMFLLIFLVALITLYYLSRSIIRKYRKKQKQSQM